MLTSDFLKYMTIKRLEIFKINWSEDIRFKFIY